MQLSDSINTFVKFRSWIYLAYFDLKLKYRKTYLGPLWIVFGMAISAGLLCFIWSIIFKLDWQNYLLYIFSGFIIWTWFTAIVVEGPEIFTNNSELLKTFAIPPIFHVLRRVFFKFVTFPSSFTINSYSNNHTWGRGKSKGCIDFTTWNF